MSDPIEPFTIEVFPESSKRINAEFVAFFDKPEEERRDEAAEGQVVEKIDIEDEARRIFEDAYIQGEKAGHEMGMLKVEQIAKRLNGYLSELSSFKRELMERAEYLSTELALIFSEAIILKECAERKDIILRMVKKALEICEDKSDIVIRMRREDTQYISFEGMSHLKLVPDDAIEESGFIIQTNFGDIDGRISTQIEELKKELFNGHPR